MELDELIYLGACSLYRLFQPSKSVANDAREMAVKEAKAIWKEVVREDREE